MSKKKVRRLSTVYDSNKKVKDDKPIMSILNVYVKKEGKTTWKWILFL